MEDIQHHQQQPSLRPSFPPTTSVKWNLDVGSDSKNHDRTDGAEGTSFGQDSGYTSYQLCTPNNTFNRSSRCGTSGILATIDEMAEADCSMNDSSGGNELLASGSIHLTPTTAASIEQFSKFHLTTPKSSDRSTGTRRPSVFDYDGGPGDSGRSTSFLAPSSPNRLAMSRSISFESPLPTGKRSARHSSLQTTPHKAKGPHSMKRKHSAFREKLYSEYDDGPVGDENRPQNLNDSLDADCRRLEDISPIPNGKRRKHNDQGIEELMRSSTPKTVSSKPVVKRTLRKFQSFSPSKMQSTRGKTSMFERIPREERHPPPGRTAGLVRQNAIAVQERTPEKNNQFAVDGTPVKKPQQVLTECRPTTSTEGMPPMDLNRLLDGQILAVATPQLEQTVTSVPLFDDFSLTPSKANLTDPEFLPKAGDGGSFVSDDVVTREAANFSYCPKLNSILEESPNRAAIIVGKVAKTPPSVTKSGRKLKRLGTASSVASCMVSPVRNVLTICRPTASPFSPIVRRGQASLCTSLKSVKPYNYCGYEYLNILHHLNKWNKDVLETLLEYFTDPDLVQVVQVSRNWRSIIQNHPKTWNRLQRYLKQQHKRKENIYSRSFGHGFPHPSNKTLGAATNGTLTEDINGNASSTVKRCPFKMSNSLDNSHTGNRSLPYGLFGNLSMPDVRCRRSSMASVPAQHSPVVSPSKRKFVANQKVASLLKQSDQLRPCPRCEKPSRIIYSCESVRNKNQNKSRASALSNAIGARLEKSYTLPNPDTGTNLPEGNAHSSASIDAGRRNDSHTDGYCNNSGYSADSTSFMLGDSPNRVRKNLFNNDTKPALQTTPSIANGGSIVRSNNFNRMKLRSAVKSVDHVSDRPTVGDDLLGEQDSKCDYAICSAQNCRFQFCIKCLCTYHRNTACSDLSPNSPTKEEERGRPYVACSRQSRRSLQRLCRKL